jgi:hypothetical protein
MLRDYGTEANAASAAARAIGCSSTVVRRRRDKKNRSGGKANVLCSGAGLPAAELLGEILSASAGVSHTASFAAFTGRALTIFRAGLALNTVGSFVNGLMPARSFVAGFLMTTNFAKPGNKNAPFFFNSL